MKELLILRRKLGAQATMSLVAVSLCLVTRSAVAMSVLPDLDDWWNRWQQKPDVSIDIRADVNGDGLVDVADSEYAELESKGVIVLPNLDDDAMRCIAFKEMSDKYVKETEAFIGCNDAADQVSNGREDIEDFTLIELVSSDTVPEDGTINIAIVDSNGKVEEKSTFRILVREGDTFFDISNQPLTLDHLRNGAKLAVESTDIIRDSDDWDGSAWLRVELRSGGRLYFDELPLRVAPVITQHELGRASHLFMSPQGTEDEYTNEVLENATPEQQAIFDSLRYDRVASRFVNDITNNANDVVSEVVTFRDMFGDIWTQDIFEPAFVSRPTAAGAQVMRIMLRSANSTSSLQVDWTVLPQLKDKTEEEINEILSNLTEEEYFELYDRARNAMGTRAGLRESGVALYSELRGPDIGVVQIEPEYLGKDEGLLDTFNSTGNFTTAPPYYTQERTYLEGRMIYGSTPNPRFITLLEAQGLQDPVRVPTEWLHVGHVDEFISILPSNNARGWVLAVADPELAYNILMDAKNQSSGENKVLSGKYFVEDIVSETGTGISYALTSYEKSLDDILNDDDLRKANDVAIKGIDEALVILRDALELTDDDIVRLPVMYKISDSRIIDEDSSETPQNLLSSRVLYNKSIAPSKMQQVLAASEAAEPPIEVSAFFPNAINGVYLGDYVFVSPQQFGPVVDGIDLLQKAAEVALAPHGIDIRWVDDFDYAHLGGGEIHCVSNSYRDLSDVEIWWQD